MGERAIFEGGLRQMRCSMLTDGHAFKMPPAFFNEEFPTGGKPHDLVMRSLEAGILETSQTALCTQMHPPEQRLSRWLLTFADRLGSAHCVLLTKPSPKCWARGARASPMR